MASLIPEIPHDKLYHVFVCYEKNSLDIVRIVVDNLEKDGIMCCYYDRDFTPGRSIIENMYEAIGKSMNMLVVLSEEFENSLYCADEIDKAFNLRVRGEYNLIPIRIEPCSVPECLRHLVYIDVEDSIDTAHVKIKDAISKKELQIELREEKNGEYVQFEVHTYTHCMPSFTRYRLKFTETERAVIWNNQFEAFSVLQTKLWNISKQNIRQTGVLFFLNELNVYPNRYLRFNIMHYNLKSCELYFARQLEKRESLKKFRMENETNEECTSRLFNEYLSQSCAELVDTSIKRRHKMKNNAKCVCLLVEGWLKQSN